MIRVSLLIFDMKTKTSASPFPFLSSRRMCFSPLSSLSLSRKMKVVAALSVISLCAAAPIPQINNAIAVTTALTALAATSSASGSNPVGDWINARKTFALLA
jgi:hypothetical protein